MLQFARRRRWFLSLTLLVTVVTVQQLMPADGAAGREEHGTVTYEEDVTAEEDGESYGEQEPEDQPNTESSPHRVSVRARKRAWPSYGKSAAILLPLFVLGLAAAFAGAGYVVKQRKAQRRAAPLRTSDKAATTTVQKKISKTAPSAAGSTAAISPTRLQSLIQIGKRSLPPAAALALVTLVVSSIISKYDIQALLGQNPPKQ